MMMKFLRLNNKICNRTFSSLPRVPWFPKSAAELDRVAGLTLDAGEELESDHPGFSDENYRKQRKEIAHIAETYTFGESIRSPTYTKEEVATWGAIYNRLWPLVQKHGCIEHINMFHECINSCGFQPSKIPELQDVNTFLNDRTGFVLRPVAGLLSSRNFLYGLAFRVFFSTQYIRHHSKPFYTPEPDICHELLGHAPLFADKAFADFAQEIGLASLGSSEEQIVRLSRCFWYTAEFGLCMQNGERKAYGAGLLSSYGELEYSMTDEPIIVHFDPEIAGTKDFPITTFQPVYYISNSFEEAKEEMKMYAENMKRPFEVVYNDKNRSIDVIGNIEMETIPMK